MFLLRPLPSPPVAPPDPVGRLRSASRKLLFLPRVSGSFSVTSLGEPAGREGRERHLASAEREIERFERKFLQPLKTSLVSSFPQCIQ